MKRSGTYNRIWLPVMLLLTALLAWTAFRGMRVQALALEQQARCGIEVHAHGEDCYSGDTLICTTPVHAHSKNCYLVLLKDNDINTLLAQVDKQQEHSLEGLIGQTVDSALRYNTDLTSPMVTTQAEPVDVAAINETIVEQQIDPMIVLNENLYSSASASDGALPQEQTQSVHVDTPSLQPEQPEAPAAQLPAVMEAVSGGNTVSPMALDDPVSTGSSMGNYYIYLDGSWRSLGNMSFSTARSGTRYYARETTTDIVTLYNHSLDLSLTASDLNLIYATSANAASYSWTDATFSGNYTYFGNNYSRQSDARKAKYIRLVDESGDPLAFYTVTLEYPDGTEEVRYVRSGDTVELPEEYVWQSDGDEYAGGTQVEIYAKTTFTASEADGKFRISYDVNFPTVSGVTVDTKPTLVGTAETVVTDTMEQGTDARLRNVSQTDVDGSVNGNTVGLSRVIHFSGWQVEGTDVILSPNSTVTWQELQAYTGGGSRLELTGVWEYRAMQTASFYIRYDSVAVDTEGNMTSQDSNLYTPELFVAFVGGEDAASLSTSQLNNLYYIADTSSDNSYGADQEIRALYGQHTGIWLQSFPRDEDVFEQLKSYATYLQVDGEPVDVNELNDSAYAIRWYVFKCQDDAWHIDGRLVKKEGFLDVTKHFAGNLEAIAAARNGFSIRAWDEDGEYDYHLCIEEPEEPTDGTVLIPSYTDGMTYTWELDGIEYGELWTLAEDPGLQQDNMIVHSGYRVVDAYNQQNKNGSGTEVEVNGMTYATDMGEIQALRVEFTNIYHATDSIIIKKEDAATGSPIGGAMFGLEQNGEELRFVYDEAQDRYIYDPEYGDITELSGSESGYYEIVIEGFSYDNGEIVVQELQPPEGYTPVESLTIGYDEDGEISLLTPTDMAAYEDGLLVVKNSTEALSVSVQKQWLCPEEEQQPVTVQLLANGLPVTVLIPGVEPDAVLDESNAYFALWEDLPLYANGRQIEWSVRETQIGNEDCLSDFTFANWLVDYGVPDYTYDEDGALAAIRFTVTNDTRRTMLRLIKTNMGGGIRLGGAEFMLERLLEDGTEDSEFIVRTASTADDGTITFDNVKYGDYRLTETAQPSGYVEMELPVYLTIHTDGTVTVQEHPYAMPGSTAFTVHVKNQPESPMPVTGGGGTGGYTAIGLLLMLMALGWALPKYRRKGGAPPAG